MIDNLITIWYSDTTWWHQIISWHHVMPWHNDSRECHDSMTPKPTNSPIVWITDKHNRKWSLWNNSKYQLKMPTKRFVIIYVSLGLLNHVLDNMKRTDYGFNISFQFLSYKLLHFFLFFQADFFLSVYSRNRRKRAWTFHY